MAYPGRRTIEATRIFQALLFTVLAVAGLAQGLPVHVVGTPSLAQGDPPISTSPDDRLPSELPQLVGADPVSGLSLPQTVVSSIDKLIGTGRVIQTSRNNLTIYNQEISLRLIGTPFPHDELLGRDNRLLSDQSFWHVEVAVGDTWVPLRAVANNFTALGTNSTGAFVKRTLQIETGPYSGVLTIVYKALSAGPLRWDLQFTANSFGSYRIVYSWKNITDKHALGTASKQFRVDYGTGNYTFSWSDVPESLSSTATIGLGNFRLNISLGDLPAGSTVSIDPSLISTNINGFAPTAQTFQRKVFYEPVGGNYWVFYYGQTYGYESLWYAYSHDGISWKSYSMPQSWPAWVSSDSEVSFPAVISFGQTVVVAAGDSYEGTYSGNWTRQVALHYIVGNITGSNGNWAISWGSVGQTGVLTGTCTFWTAPGCSMSLGVRNVNIAFSKYGNLTFAFNYYKQIGSDPACSYFPSMESDLYVLYGKNPTLVEQSKDCVAAIVYDHYRSVLIPSADGSMRVVYQSCPLPCNFPQVELRSKLVSNNGVGQVEYVDQSVADGSELTGVSDASFGAHVLYRAYSAGVNYAYRPASGLWSKMPLFPASYSSPTITVDSSTSDLYAFAIQGSSIAMVHRPSGEKWSDQSTILAVTNRNVPSSLGSNYASASGSGSTQIALIWTEGSGPYNATFASIPITTAWSPFATPSDPWDGNGLAPYGQYFNNLGEYVSPSNGMLTIVQRDLNVPGRGLNLEFTRVYTEPYTFLNGKPYLYESYPWAPLGNGWQLNFPWMNNSLTPQYIHLWNGEGYRIPTGFWLTGPSSVYVNHQGENFQLVRNITGVFLLSRSGVNYKFDPSHSNRLSKITDALGNNINTG